MPWTSIKVRAEDKADLDRLQHEVALATGEQVAQHELVRRLLAFALRSKKEFVGQGAPRARTRKDWAKLQVDLPLHTDANADLDRVVYGLDER
jgi:hypothetical protein